MTKIRLYLPPQEIKRFIALEKRGSLHKLKNVLRLKKNQKIYIFDGNGKEWECKIEEITQKKITINRIKKYQEVPATNQKLSLGFPLIQEKKIDFILQKATELGITEFIPYHSSRTKSRVTLQGDPTRIKRWEKIIIEACRQSEHLWIPNINHPTDLKHLFKQDFDLKLIALPNKNDKIITLKNKPKKILCVVGPEGGFSNEELAGFKKHNFSPINLSENILRTETAAIFVSGLIKYLIQ